MIWFGSGRYLNLFDEDKQSKVESEKNLHEVHVMNRHHRQASYDGSVNSSSADPSADLQDVCD